MTLVKALGASASAIALIEHAQLRRMREEALSEEEVGIVLGQWYHPLSYFPVFLCRVIALCPNITAMTYISKIVWQELGEGIPDRAHREIFTRTMSDVGFDPAAVSNAEPLPATKALVREYGRLSGASYAESLGCLYATEAADLAMVSSIGSAVRRFSGVEDLAWVDIHVHQEPDHTDAVNCALEAGLNERERRAVAEGAEQLFGRWCDFFSAIEDQMRAGSSRDQKRASVS